RIRIEPVAPRRLRVAMLIDAAHFGILAVRTELLRRIDCEQHGLPLADIGAKLLAREGDEPDVLLAHHQIANALAIGNECWHSCGLFRSCRITEPKTQHDVSPSSFHSGAKDHTIGL